MPLVLRHKRQTAAPGTCPSGFNFYACNNAQPVWTGCCARDPCTTGCPDDAQPDDDDEDADASPLATQSSTATTTLTTLVSTSGAGGATASTAGADSISSATPSTAQTSSSSFPTSTVPAEDIGPSSVTEDPSTQTLTSYADAVGDDPKSPPHTEKSDVPAIIGATLGAAGIVILVFLLVFCFRRRQRRKELRRRRPDVIPSKRDSNNEDAASNTHNANAAAGATRSIARSHDRKPRSSSQNGSNHEMRSIYSNSTRKGQPAPSLDEPTTIPSTDDANHDRATSPVRNDFVTTTDHNRHASYVNKASLSGGDPTSWSRYSSINPTPNPADLRSPSRSPSRSPGRQSVMAGPSSPLINDVKADPYTGEVRLSRATGSIFTPAQGATTSPTITINAA